jgi:hypothetical protein
MLEVRVDLPPTSLLDAAQRRLLLKTIDMGHRITERAASNAKDEIRKQMASAGLGRLGNAITHGSDFRKGKRVKPLGGLDFAVSGFVFIRRAGERTRGAINAYTNDPITVIRPRASALLWFPTDDIQRLVGRGRDRKRLEPRDWEKFGLDRKIGPLINITAKDGTELLVVKNASLSASGKAGSLKGLTKRGKPRKGQVAAEIVVAFIGIPQTKRSRRVDVRQIAEKEQGKMRQYAIEYIRANP